MAVLDPFHRRLGVFIFVAALRRPARGRDEADSAGLPDGCWCVSGAGGRLVMAFADVVEALNWAVREAKVASKGGPSASIGISAGHLAAGQNPIDCIATERSLAIADMADAGQVLVAAAAYEIARDVAPEAFGFMDLGAPLLPGVGRRDRIYQLRHPKLSLEVRTLRSEEIRLQVPPYAFGLLIGREHEIEFVSGALERTRVVSLVGGGGIGKSHLAYRVAQDLQRLSTDGAIWVDLTGCNSVERLLEVLASSIGISPNQAADAIRSRLARDLRGRDLLIILDGCDRCAGPVAALVKDLLRSSGPRFLITSCRRPAIPQQEAYVLQPLTLPPPDLSISVLDLENFGATALFIERMDEVAAGALPHMDPATVASICRQLEGHPLAIRLAAYRTRYVSVGRILTSLKSAPPRDQSGTAPASGRHKSLAAAVSWSSKALSPEALELLHAVAAFVGPWRTTDAAALAETDDALLIPHLVELSDAGLVTSEDGAEDTFRTPRRIADMALASLSADNRAEVMERHGVYFLALLARESRNADGPFPGDHLNAIDRHLPDIIAALDYTLSAVRHVPTFRDAMVLSWTYWYQHNHLQEAQRLLERGARMAKAQAPYDAARMLNLAGVLATKAGDVTKARAYYKKAYSHLSGRAHDRLSAALLSNLAHLEWSEADPFKAVDTFANAVAAWRKLDDRANLAQTLSSSVPSLVETGRANDAERALNEAIELGYGTSDALGRWAIQLAKAQIMMAFGRHAEAVEYCVEAARQVRDTGDDVTLARTLLRLAEGLEAIGRAETAAQALGWAMSAAQASEAGMYRTNELRAAGLEGRLRKTLGGPEFESARVAGILSNLANLLYLSGKVA